MSTERRTHHVGFDTDTMQIHIPGNHQVRIWFPNGSFMQHFAAQESDWTLTYRMTGGDLPPGLYTIELEAV